jgi:hypothetical protein
MESRHSTLQELRSRDPRSFAAGNEASSESDWANPSHPPLATVLLEVIQPLELHRLAGDEVPIALNALQIREMHEAKPWAIWGRDSAPTILVVPEGDSATAHER